MGFWTWDFRGNRLEFTDISINRILKKILFFITFHQKKLPTFHQKGQKGQKKLPTL